MKSINSLNRNRDFKRIYSKGKYASSKLLVTYVLKNRLKTIRVGITTSKKVGNAVQRNRCRRIIRAAYFPIQKQLPQGFDIVFVARNETPNVKSYDISRDMLYQFRKIGLLK